jgi:hypothetical protein
MLIHGFKGISAFISGATGFNSESDSPPDPTPSKAPEERADNRFCILALWPPPEIDVPKNTGSSSPHSNPKDFAERAPKLRTRHQWSYGPEAESRCFQPRKGPNGASARHFKRVTGSALRFQFIKQVF